jgi:hypothetical protein
MVTQPFRKAYGSPSEQAWRQGQSPYAGTLGPYPSAASDPESFKNGFVEKMRANPDSKNFYNSSVFGSDTAGRSQAKIDAASETDQPSFAGSGDNALAKDFVSKYSQAIERGLIEEDRAVTRDGLARIASQSATEGSSERDPNTTNKFPGASGASI